MFPAFRAPPADLREELKPHCIGRLFWPDGPAILWKLKACRPRTRFLLLGGAILLLVIVITGLSGGLVGHSTRPSAIRLTLSGAKKPDLDNVEMPLLQDPIGILAVLVALMTPVFCAAQVEAIPKFPRMVVRNGGLGYLEPGRSSAHVDECIRQANARFAGIGGRRWSPMTLLVAAALSALLYWALASFGLLESWNFTGRKDDRKWAKAVYDGWWANADHHPQLAIMLWLLGTYLFYFLIKQIWVGFVFNWFAVAASRHGFGVCAQMRYNADNYWGLRPLRGFMEWTYWSALSDFLLALGVFVVWLPSGLISVLVTTVVTVVTIAVVIAPSRLAHESAVRAKTMFVDNLVRKGSSVDEAVSKEVEAIWAAPILPFRVRNTVTAIALYLFIPLLGLVPSLLGK